VVFLGLGSAGRERLKGEIEVRAADLSSLFRGSRTDC